MKDALRIVLSFDLNKYFFKRLKPICVIAFVMNLFKKLTELQQHYINIEFWTD